MRRRTRPYEAKKLINIFYVPQRDKTTGIGMMAGVTAARRRNKWVRRALGGSGLRQGLVKGGVLDQRWKIFKKKTWNMWRR